jgi:hypothetical protein
MFDRSDKVGVEVKKLRDQLCKTIDFPTDLQITKIKKKKHKLLIQQSKSLENLF